MGGQFSRRATFIDASPFPAPRWRRGERERVRARVRVCVCVCAGPGTYRVGDRDVKLKVELVLQQVVDVPASPFMPRGSKKETEVSAVVQDQARRRGERDVSE